MFIPEVGYRGVADPREHGLHVFTRTILCDTRNITTEQCIVINGAICVLYRSTGRRTVPPEGALTPPPPTEKYV
jgi:hypothetical protein